MVIRTGQDTVRLTIIYGIAGTEDTDTKELVLQLDPGTHPHSALPAAASSGRLDPYLILSTKSSYNRRLCKFFTKFFVVANQLHIGSRVSRLRQFSLLCVSVRMFKKEFESAVSATALVQC
jgi:hypothetical protein